MITISDLKQITISVTKNCNLDCVWCFEDAKNWSTNLLTTKDIFNLLETTSGFVRGVTFTGGEPFVRKDIKELILKALNLEFSEIAIASNGIAISKHIEPLLRHENVFLGISIDGDEEQHDSIRGLGTFTKTMDRIKELTNSGIKIVLVMTVSKRNLASVDKVLGLVPNLDVLGISFQRLRCIGRGNFFQGERLTSEELKMLAQKIELAKKTSNGFFVSLKDPMRNILNEEFSRTYGHYSQNHICGGCQAGMSYIYICDDGTIQPCAFMKVKLGNVLKDDLFKIWETSNVLQAIRVRDFYKVCKDCENWNMCRGCRADAYSDTGDYMAGDPLCWKK